MDDLSLVNKIKAAPSDCDSEVSILAEKHKGLFVNVLNRCEKFLQQKNISLEEINQEYYYIVYKAAIKFNTDKKTKFSSWLGNYIKFYCLTKAHYVKNEDNLSLLESEEEISQIPDLTKDYSEINGYFNHILNSFEDKRVAKIFKMRYFDRKPKKWKDIGEALGLSGPATINIHNRVIKVLSAKLKATNCFDKV